MHRTCCDSLRRTCDAESFEEAILDSLTVILSKIHRLEIKQGIEMTDISTLTTDVATLTSSVAGAKVALDDLAAKVAALTAGAVSQADIDALDASVTAASASLNDAVATDDPAPVVAPVEPAQPDDGSTPAA